MEPIPFFFDSINRNAIMVTPKQPLLDWVNSIHPDNPVDSIDEGTIYLVKVRDTNEQTENWLKRNFDKIFQNELNDWYTDENDWPVKRTFKLFKEWFRYEISSMVLDMEEYDVIKD